MSAKFTIEGSGSGAVKAVDSTTQALDNLDKTADKAAKTSKRLEEQLNKQAQRIKESIDPQERFNRKYAELQQHLDAGRLTTDQVTAATAKLREEMTAAVGPGPLSNVVKMAAAYVSVSQALGVVTSELREQARLREEAAQKARDSTRGLGSLSQLAATMGSTPEARQAAFASLVAEARGFVATGAASSENEGGRLLFDLVSAGVGTQDRQFAARLQSQGTLDNVGGAAQAFDALTTALGGEEVGSFQKFMSKALQAASVAPGSFEQLPIALTAAGGSAKALGVSDEFLLAAGAVLAKKTGSPSEAATQLAAFLKQSEKSGLRGIQGIGGTALVEKLGALPQRQQEFGGVLGDRAEAIEGFRTLRDALPQVMALEKEIAAAVDSDLAGQAAALPASDPQLRAALGAQRAKGGLDVVRGQQMSTKQNVIEAIRADRRAWLQENYIGGEFGQGWQEGLRDFFGTSGIEISNATRVLEAGGNPGLSKETIELLKDYNRRTAEAAEATAQQQRARVNTRQE